MKQRFPIIKVSILIIISAIFIKYSIPRYLAFFQSKDSSKPYLSLYYKSKELLANGKKEEALKAAQEAVDFKPIYGKIYLQLGFVYYKMQNYDEAVKYYKESLHRPMNQVNQAIAHNNLGVIYLQQFSFYEKAVAHYRKSFELLPKNEKNSRGINPLDGLVEALVYNNQFEFAKQLVEEYSCETQYCQWLKGVKKKPPTYPDITREKLSTKSMFFSGVRTESQYKNGVGAHGFSRVYYQDGVLMTDQNYKNGNLDGIQRGYYDDGKLAYERIYKQGKLLGEDGQPFSGKNEVFHKNGTLNQESIYTDGVQNGLTKYYTENKLLISEVLYKDGHHKKAKKYYQTGELQADIDFEVQDGIYQITYYESGKVKSEHFREKGKVISEKFYDENGNYLGDRRNPQIDSIEIIKAGVFKNINQDKIKEYPRNFCFLGTSEFTPEMVHATDILEAELNITFGIAYRVHGRPDEGTVELIVKYIHPPLTNPRTGKVTIVEEVKSYSNVNEINTATWIFQEKWEIASGQWIIQLFNKEKKLAETTFTVL